MHPHTLPPTLYISAPDMAQLVRKLGLPHCIDRREYHRQRCAIGIGFMYQPHLSRIAAIPAKHGYNLEPLRPRIEAVSA